MRILSDFLMPILLPTVLWLLWLAWRRQSGRSVGPETVPWVWLLVAGGILALLLAFGGALLRGTTIGQYQPAHLDALGHLVPGRLVPDPAE